MVHRHFKGVQLSKVHVVLSVNASDVFSTNILIARVATAMIPKPTVVFVMFNDYKYHHKNFHFWRENTVILSATQVMFQAVQLHRQHTSELHVRPRRINSVWDEVCGRYSRVCYKPSINTISVWGLRGTLLSRS